MKLTTKQLKKLIAEEMQNLDESFGRHMAGETDRTAAAMQDTDHGQRHLEVSGIILDLARTDLEHLVNAIGMLPHNAREAIKNYLSGGKGAGGQRDDSKFQMGAEKYGGSDYYTPFQESNKKTKKRK